MKTYDVVVPITGVIYVTVKAESEEDAIDAALNSSDLTTENIQEWEAHDKICQGNVFNGMQNDAEVVDCYDDEEVEGAA